jgi:hypothetical protein
MQGNQGVGGATHALFSLNSMYCNALYVSVYCTIETCVAMRLNLFSLNLKLS